MPSDKDFMAMALDLARLGLGRTSPNPAVGAVIVKKGRVIGTGFHKGPGRAHAEIEALSSRRRGGGGEVWKGATLYVTLEPCCPPKPGGRTPPCTDRIIKSGIREVVVGMRDPDRRVSGKGIRLLKKNGIRVRVGVLQAECERLNEAYVKHRRTGTPFVTLKIASTLDGKVAVIRGRRRWITGPEAREFGHRVRDRVDSILVGIRTIEKDNPRLTTRIGRKRGHDPIRIVLDTNLRIKPTARVFRPSSPTWVASTVKPTDPKVRLLQKMGVQVLFCRKGRGGKVDLKDLLKKLGEREVLSLLVEGGPTVWSSFLREKLADRFLLFVAPFFLGKGGPKITLEGGRLIGRDLLIEGSLKARFGASPLQL